MDLRRYSRLLRVHWTVIVANLLAGTFLAAALARTGEPLYRAHTQMFVAATTSPATTSSPAQRYQGGLFSQQRVLSYAHVVSSAAVAQAVITQLGLSRSVEEVQSEIRASVVPNTVLLDVEVTDRSPRVARAIAGALGTQFPRFINSLEGAGSADTSPVKVSVTSAAPLQTTRVSRHKAIYLFAGVLLGLVAGLGGAALVESLYRRVGNARNAARIAAAPILGSVAHIPKAGEHTLARGGDAGAPAADAFRRLRTNVGALSSDFGLGSVVVASAVPAEGKTLIAANLALAFAQADRSVIVVDCDLRRPTLAKALGFATTTGLSDVLAGEAALESALYRHHTLPLTLLAAGAPAPNPSELLASKRCARLMNELTGLPDLVIIDTPALLQVTDAAILARLASAVVVVARASWTRTRELDAAVRSLHSVGRPPLGVVLNDVPAGDGSPFGYHAPEVDVDRSMHATPAGPRS